MNLIIKYDIINEKNINVVKTSNKMIVMLSVGSIAKVICIAKNEKSVKVNTVNRLLRTLLEQFKPNITKALSNILDKKICETVNLSFVN